MKLNKIICEDAFEEIKKISDESVNMILTDIPYGETGNDWDKDDIDLGLLMSQFGRIVKQDGCVAMTATMRLAVEIMKSVDLWRSANYKLNYKYEWVWEKDNGTNFLNSHYQPLKITEDICVFGKLGCSWNRQGNMLYFPQFEQGKAYTCVSGNQKKDSAVVRVGKGGREEVSGHITESDGKRYHKNIIRFNRDKEKLHPTQKPVALCEYLIKTYTNKGDLVWDNCIGSGTTAVACKQTGRDYIGFEMNPEYAKIAEERIKATPKPLTAFTGAV